MTCATFDRIKGEEGRKGYCEGLGLHYQMRSILFFDDISSTMVKNMTQSSHHKFRVILAREYSLRPITIEESEQKTHVTVSNS